MRSESFGEQKRESVVRSKPIPVGHCESHGISCAHTVGREGPPEAALGVSQARERQRDENAEQQRCRQLAIEQQCSRRCDTDGSETEEEGCEAEHFSELRGGHPGPAVDERNYTRAGQHQSKTSGEPRRPS